MPSLLFWFSLTGRLSCSPFLVILNSTHLLPSPLLSISPWPLVFFHRAISLLLILVFLFQNAYRSFTSLPLVFSTPSIPPFLSSPLPSSLFLCLSALLTIVCRRWWEYHHQGQINIIPLHTRARKTWHCQHTRWHVEGWTWHSSVVCVCVCFIGWGVKMKTLESFSSLLPRCNSAGTYVQYVHAHHSDKPAWHSWHAVSQVTSKNSCSKQGWQPEAAGSLRVVN